MIVVTGQLRVKPENVERLRPHMRTVLTANRKEEGCVHFVYGEDVLDPGLIHIVEHWRDWEALRLHIESAHLIAWRSALTGIGVISREVTAFETSSSRAL